MMGIPYAQEKEGISRMNKRTIKRIVLASIVLSIGILVFGSYIYYNKLCASLRRKLPSPETAALIAQHYKQIMALPNARTVTFSAHDGPQLHGILITRSQARRIIMLCHGYHRTKESMEPYIKLFPHDTILLFDFRGHGQSCGDLVSIGYYETQDIFAALDFLHHEPATQKLPIIGFGVSMGGSSLIAAASKTHDFKALILDSSFASLAHEVAHQLELQLPKFLLPLAQRILESVAGFCLSVMTPARAIKKVRCPILIIHSHDDPFTPVHHAHTLYRASTVPNKQLWIVTGSAHADAFKDYPQEYQERVHAFLKQIR
jgi:pimeloyl-ACP methyl ester carboxylesterase